MSIPLIQEATKDAINTSIIAIKRQIERINMLLGLSNSEEIDTSKFATKEELQQAVTDLQPVNEVAVDNMHSVTSNAVAESFGEWENVFGTGNIKGLETKNGKYLTFHFQGYSASYGQVLGTVVQRWIPSSNLYIPFINGCFLVLDTNGNIGSYNSSGGSFQLYGDAVVLFN